MLVRVGYHREENILSFDEASQVGILIRASLQLYSSLFRDAILVQNWTPLRNILLFGERDLLNYIKNGACLCENE